MVHYKANVMIISKPSTIKKKKKKKERKKKQRKSFLKITRFVTMHSKIPPILCLVIL